MQLRFLLNEAGIPSNANDTEIRSVTDRLDDVTENTLFVCIDGAAFRGTDAVAEAASRGAVFFVSESPLEGVGYALTQNARRAFSLLSAAFYGHPDRELSLIGVTGTNGKTTTARFIQTLLNAGGKKCAYIGTDGVDVDGVLTPTGYTTPGSDVFFAALRKAADAGCGFCVTEVSSMALAQYRVDGAAFRLGVFTNIGTDHLDYHGTPEKLAAAKRRLSSLSGAMLVNGDDAYAERFVSENGPTYVYSTRAILSDFSARSVRQEGFSSAFLYFSPAGVRPVRIPSPGLYSVYNALAAFAACELCGVPAETLAENAGRLAPPAGRAQFLKKNGVTVCIDFAHTPEALASILEALRGGTDGRLIAVFGAGGERDPAKRPQMGKVAALWADVVVLTSDNPRHEDPDVILSDIAKGLRRKKQVFREPDRRRAIAFALKTACPGYTVLIAGKGSETVQIVGDRRLPFSDLDTVRSL